MPHHKERHRYEATKDRLAYGLFEKLARRRFLLSQHIRKMDHGIKMLQDCADHLITIKASDIQSEK